MRFLLPAPTDLAKSTRIASNISLQMQLEMFQTVRPVHERSVGKVLKRLGYGFGEIG